MILSFKRIQTKIFGLSPWPGNDWSPLRSATLHPETSRDKAGYQTVFFFTSTMCFCLFILSLCFRMQLTYALTIHLWNSILSMLPYFHEYARCFAKSAPCVPARMWTNQIAYNYHVTSCVCRLALSYYVVKFYE